MATIASQVPKNLSFRYRVACHQIKGKVSAKTSLDETYSLPDLGDLDGQKAFADVRVGWCKEGLLIQAEVTGKKKSLWCRDTAILESDGIQVWVDTRDTHNVHRASKFCHWFVFMPTGNDDKRNPAMASALKINRSREDSPSMNRYDVDVASKVVKMGYTIRCFIPGKALHGWDVEQHQHLGFNYAVVDSELGWQTMAIGPELPISEDPSLWQSLHLVE